MHEDDLKQNDSEKQKFFSNKIDATQEKISNLNERNSTSNSKNSNQKISLKDYYSTEYQEENEMNPLNVDLNDLHNLDSKGFVNWPIFKFIFVSSLLFISAFGLFYLWSSHKNAEETINAAKHVADVSMALTYAQVKNIHPQNQNWSDPEFIRNNLKAVLASEHPSSIDFDRNGQFQNCPYMLRIYTGNHLSHFLVIAQPIPNLLHWPISKGAIVVDSNEMKLRKIADLKTFNRLLAESNSLDGAKAIEISAFVKNGELIELSQLTSDNNVEHYIPPKALNLMHPEAGNLIYNAARYQPLGQALIKQALELAKMPADMHEAALFMHELGSLSQLNNMMLYSCLGVQDAIQLQKAMNILAPEEKFLIGYLTPLTDGKTYGPHLLVDDESFEVASLDVSQGLLFERSLYSSSHKYQDEISEEFELTNEGHDELIKDQSLDISSIQEDDPIYLYLAGVIAFRQKALKPITYEMITLLNKQMEIPQYNFIEKMCLLKNKYTVLNAEQQIEIEKHLDYLIDKYKHLPCDRLIACMHAARIHPAFKEYLHKLNLKQSYTKQYNEQIDHLINVIKLSSGWSDLKEIIDNLFERLQFKKLPDEEVLNNYQISVRFQVIQKLNDFLLSSTPALPINVFTKENKLLLQGILDHSWIMDNYTHDFYLAEYDEHANALIDEE